MTQTDTKFGWSTRLFHASLATGIFLQLTSSQFMQVPRNGRPANWAFEIHEYSGTVVLALAFCFWIIVITRTGGTEAGALVPWFSTVRRAAFWADLKSHWAVVVSLRLPEYQEQSPFISAIHGLGLVLMTAMATTGTLYIIASQFSYQDNSLLHLLMDAHGAAGNLVWLYLIGHAGFAILNHFRHNFSLRDMWSIRRK